MYNVLFEIQTMHRQSLQKKNMPTTIDLRYFCVYFNFFNFNVFYKIRWILQKYIFVLFHNFIFVYIPTLISSLYNNIYSLLSKKLRLHKMDFILWTLYLNLFFMGANV